MGPGSAEGNGASKVDLKAIVAETHSGYLAAINSNNFEKVRYAL